MYASSVKGHSLLPRSPPTGVLVNRRGIGDSPGSYAFADPLEVFHIFPRGTLVLLDKLHECWCLAIGQDDTSLLLWHVRVAAGMLFVTIQQVFHV